MADEGTVGHGVVKKSKHCSCTADWVTHDGHGSHSHRRWAAIVPLVAINVFTFVLGLCFLGVSAYLTATFESHPIKPTRIGWIQFNFKLE